MYEGRIDRMSARIFQEFCCAVSLFVLMSPTFVFGDSLRGRVLDPSRNIVPDAKIKLFDRTSAQQRNTVSDSDGSFRFEGIPAGTYLLETHGADSVLVS